MSLIWSESICEEITFISGVKEIYENIFTECIDNVEKVGSSNPVHNF